MKEVYVIGAGLTGAAAAHKLAYHGFAVTVLEAAKRVGGHILNEWFKDIPYEPNGAHIFHTNDTEVWQLANSMTTFVPYEHQVLTRLGDSMYSWPVQVAELQEMDAWSKIKNEIANLPEKPNALNFETWCVSLMGETIYELFIEGYTIKQWGRHPRELSAAFAPKRVELRRDGFRGLFRDRYQGWPQAGYSCLIDGLLENSNVQLATPMSISNIKEVIPPGAPVIVTAPLDSFFEEREGYLEWRGVDLVPKFYPNVMKIQDAMVVNQPSLEVRYTRSIETKHVFPNLLNAEGTVVCYEYPGSPSKHYPVLDSDGVNALTQKRYIDRLENYGRNNLHAAGRLARYEYINMDEAMRQGLDVAQIVIES